jgi:hypothetical protein
MSLEQKTPVIHTHEILEDIPAGRFFGPARVPVTSSNLKAVGYEPGTSTLEVEFVNGGLYRYDAVPEHLHRGLMSARSKGTFFHEKIKKGGFDCTPLIKSPTKGTGRKGSR